ncbi:MAG TPA: DMT family transporter [Thermoanaerobaculia bacterium]
MTLPVKLKVHAALVGVAFFFSLNYIISKLGMRELAPLAFAWMRVAGGAIALAVIARNEPPLARDDARRVISWGFLGVAINATLFLVGLSMTTVQAASVLITSIPVFALGAAIALGRERLSWQRACGIALACAGALLVVGGESIAGTWRSAAGALMIVVNCLSYSLYLVISKPYMTRLSARAVVARMFAVGATVLLPVCAWTLWHQQWRAVSPRGWLALALVIAGPTVGAYLLQAWALRHAEASMVAAYTYVQPVLATTLGAVFLGEEIRSVVLVAAALIFAGVWLAGRAAPMM